MKILFRFIAVFLTISFVGCSSTEKDISISVIKHSDVTTKDFVGVFVYPLTNRQTIWLAESTDHSYNLIFQSMDTEKDLAGGYGDDEIFKLISIKIEKEQDLNELYELCKDKIESKDTSSTVFYSGEQDLFSIKYVGKGMETGLLFSTKIEGKSWTPIGQIATANELNRLFGKYLDEYVCSCGWGVAPDKNPEPGVMISTDTIKIYGSYKDTASFKTVKEAYTWCMDFKKEIMETFSEKNPDIKIREGQQLLFITPRLANVITTKNLRRDLESREIIRPTVYKMRLTESKFPYWENEISMDISGDEMMEMRKKLK